MDVNGFSSTGTRSSRQIIVDAGWGRDISPQHALPRWREGQPTLCWCRAAFCPGSETQSAVPAGRKSRTRVAKESPRIDVGYWVSNQANGVIAIDRLSRLVADSFRGRQIQGLAFEEVALKLSGCFTPPKSK